MSDEEYEVESIQRAKLVKIRSKYVWSYYVKWKGYSQGENTWEPPESFGGSEHFILQFWERIDLQGRDWENVSEFTKDEEFFPTGPPRRRPKKPKPEPKVPSTPRGHTPVDSESEVRSLINDETSNGNVVTAAKVPGSKRKRGDNTPDHPDEDAVEASSSRKVSRRHSHESVAVIQSRNRRAPVPRDQPLSASTGASRMSERKSAKDSRRLSKALLVDSSPDEMLLRPDEAVHGRDTVTAAAQTVLKPANAPPSPDGSLFGGDDADIQRDQTHARMDEEYSISFGDPVLLHPGTESRLQPPAIDTTESAPALPAHRARAQNPRVKIIDDPRLVANSISSAIPVKAKIIKSVASNGNVQLIGGPSKSSHKSAPRVSGSKAGPGRSSIGLNISGGGSLLTFNKGSLTTVKGRGRRSTVNSAAPVSYDANEGGRTMSGDVDEASLPSAPPSPPSIVQPPTAQELLHMAGFNDAEAEALPDFEDQDAHGEPDPDVELHEIVPSQVAPSYDTKQPAVVSPKNKIAEDKTVKETAEQSSGQGAREQSSCISLGGTVVRAEADGSIPDQMQEERAAELRPATDNKAATSIPNGHFSAWKLTTIFGPLGIGQEVPHVPETEASASCISTHSGNVLHLSLDSALSLPALLKDIHPPGTSLEMLGDRTAIGPPGKFYRDSHAHALVDSLKAEGFTARLVLNPTADETQKQQFDHFCTRLQTGEVFMEMFSVTLLAMCSSENQVMGQKLHVPTDLLGLSNSIVVSQVAIENQSYYADAVMHADDIRWPA